MNPFAEDHPPDDVLEAFASGRLPVAVADQVADHVDRCTPCSSKAAVTILELGELPQLLRAAQETQEGRYTQSSAPPERIGRYRIETILGQGGFGVVFLAFDEKLNRPVAIKVPHSRLVAQAGDADAYLVEARTVANLDHPHIVPVYDVGGTSEFPCYVVSKYISGTDLAMRLKEGPLAPDDAARLAATVAEALHYAHKQGLVHRDIKSANILIDKSDVPYITDFGLALREQDVGRGPRFAGTPAYMSPEQARGEGHRVEGRSDIFSLGVVLYELLTNKRPFRGDSRGELFEQITRVDPRPPRQLNDHIPKELERICLKALSKRAVERYTTAQEMADELLQFAGNPVFPNSRSASVEPPSDSELIRVVPKGLRAFDENDADFFLELLPGPRDRDGLPDSLRFWKSHIEEADPDKTFFTGLIYGPSGCGKSSLVRAGLLPRLAKSVLPVYVEATNANTEIRLMRCLRRQVPDLPDRWGLVESLAALRQGRFLKTGQKVLLVLDQFEQWLHAVNDPRTTELVAALRQCDGARVQSVIMVRDDFWLAVSRFLRELEVRLVEGRNSALVDLFDSEHAQRVLAAYGRAFGKLPESPATADSEQKEFLSQAVTGLAQEGKVVCVHLALFAEMFKSRPWTPASLRAVGGTAGVGITFLDQTFNAPTAPPQHRRYQSAARAVLKTLLPDGITEIKGHMRSYAELLEASGLGERSQDFEELLGMLDGELRLITPTALESSADAETIADLPYRPSPETRYYHLTHDFLVPSLREWLTLKQQETRRGRAELLLADRAAVWTARPENRQLPSLPQYLQIRLLTQPRRWTPTQRQMMGHAERYHSLRSLLLVTAVLLLGWGSYESYYRQAARGLLDRLLDADTSEVTAIVREMEPYRRRLNPLLTEALAELNQDSRRELHVNLALLPMDDTKRDYLFGRLINAEPQEFKAIRDSLAPYADELSPRLWLSANQSIQGRESERLRAAAALATFDPASERWETVRDSVCADLVSAPAVYLTTWMDALRPVRAKLLPSLSAIFRDRMRRDVERTLATEALADYAADQPQLMADLLLDADDKQFALLFPVFQKFGERGLALLTSVREQPATRQANAAVALLRMGSPETIWPLLKHNSDPTTRSYLIHRLGPLGADHRAIIAHLELEPDVSTRRALILGLGEFASIPAQDRETLVIKLLEIYREHPDPGLHGAAEWLLRQWGKHSEVKQIDHDARGKEDPLKLPLEEHEREWYVNSQGQTMVLLRAAEFEMGSRESPANLTLHENLQQQRVGRTFAISAKEVAMESFVRCSKEQARPIVIKENEAELAVAGITWYDAAFYCNWLSKKENIPEDQWCYETIDAGQSGKGMTPVADFTLRNGYRLPTEAEWEFACRAGTRTTRYFGEGIDLLPKYAWYAPHGPRRKHVGLLKPNDFGLFDMQGNVWEFCNDTALPYDPKVSVDTGNVRPVDDRRSIIMRGGSVFDDPLQVRSAHRGSTRPTNRFANQGFRLVRTIETNPVRSSPSAVDDSAPTRQYCTAK